MARFIIAYKKKKQIKLQVSGVEEYARNNWGYDNYDGKYDGADGIYIANSDKEDGTQKYIKDDGKFVIDRSYVDEGVPEDQWGWWYIRLNDVWGADFYTDGIVTGAGDLQSDGTKISKIPFLADGSSASWRFQSESYQPAAGISVTKIKDSSSENPSTLKDTLIVYSPDETRNAVYGGEWNLLDQNATGQDRVWYKKGETSRDDLHLWYNQNDGWIVISENKHDGQLQGTPGMSTNASIGLEDPYLENGQSLVWGEWDYQSTPNSDVVIFKKPDAGTNYVIVSNAGTTEVNGIYYHMPQFDDTLVQGRPKYVRYTDYSTKSGYWLFCDNSAFGSPVNTRWVICEIKNDHPSNANWNLLYSTWDDTSDINDPTTGTWSRSSGKEPLPTLTKILTTA